MGASGVPGKRLAAIRTPFTIVMVVA